MFFPLMGLMMVCGVLTFVGCIVLAVDSSTTLSLKNLLVFVIGAPLGGFGCLAVLSALVPGCLPIDVVRILAMILPFIAGRGLVWLVDR